MLSLARIAEAVGGRPVGDPATVPTSVSTDSRALSPGALFVALEGESFDGHRFCGAALEAGAAAVLVRDQRVVPAGAAAVVVADPLEALQRLAAAWRLEQPRLVLCALTGSAGKTTTKELARAILAARFSTLATAGNENNHIGVPLTLLRLGPGHERAVVEMGCNHHGEIALLASIAAPEVGLVTNVGEAHLEGLGSLEGVARAKGELLLALEPGGTAVVNLDDPRVAAMPTRARRLGFGRVAGADVRLVSARPSADGRQALELELVGARLEARLALLGAHNALNAAAASALALAAGARPEDLVVGLEQVRPPPGRLRPLGGRAGLRLIDDSYNANPRSMEVALRVLADSASGAARHALLGQMAELGEASELEHERLGRRAAEAGLETLVAVGAASAAVRAGALAAGLPADRFVEAASPEQAAELVLGRARPGDVVLVKGSRVAHMERAVAALAAEEEA